tara:strand:- start:458 stop:1234 length:777 start_codon:yes stop_codon:yes gene_type:complete
MRKYIISFLALFIFLKIAQGQYLDKKSKNQIEIGFGHQSSYLKDKNFSPLNQKGGGLATRIKYQRISKNIFGANLQISSGNIYSGPSNGFTTSFINVNLGLEYLFRLSPQEQSFQFFIGPVYNSRVLYLDWYDQDAFSYVASHGVGLKGLISKRINDKHMIRASLSIPVFQSLARPPYNGIDEFIIENQDKPADIIFSGTPTSFNDFIAFEFCVDYTYKLTKRIDWHTNYTLYTQQVMESNRFKSLSNTITTGVAIKF